MAYIIASPRGISLPYSSLFDASLRDSADSIRKSRPSDYFWNRATSTTPSVNETNQDSDENWLDYSAPALSDGEEDVTPSRKKSVEKPGKSKRFARLRRIAFKAFTLNADSKNHKNNIVTTTEIIHRQVINPGKDQKSNGKKRLTILKSWKFRSSGGDSQVKKMVAVLKRRVSASSPLEEQPKTWEEYQLFYANEQIDIHNPPLPPMNQEANEELPPPLRTGFFLAPRPADEKVRQLVVNRLGICGRNSFDGSEEGLMRAKKRMEIGDQLMKEGKVPSSLDIAWERVESISSHDSGNSDENHPALISHPQLALESPPETLEQHPLFRKIVQQCRELFGAAIVLISILDNDRQIFLAECGLDGMRDFSRDLGFCAHTILSGRKGYIVLDTHKDWRFEKNPVVQGFGIRFHAGVPLMAPNLDGSEEAEANACPIGALCVLDVKPRESFSIADRKKLVYMAEYARREIEKWFSKKMERKTMELKASEEVWNHELRRAISTHSDGNDSLESEVLSDFSAGPSTGSGRPNRTGSVSTVPTSPSSQTHMSLKYQSSLKKTGPSVFEDINAAIKPKMRTVFDLATRLIGDTLDLSLVYLLAVVPYNDSNELGQTMIISGHNIPIPVPAFDAGLHMRALRSPEGGLLYQNPSVEESEIAALQPKTSDLEAQNCESNPYASAMIMAVGTEAYHNSGGFVLAGYTADSRRVFGAEDVSFMKRFALELSRYTGKIRLL